MEDGACIAVCLELAGKQKAPLALKAFEAMRYDRVKAAQKTGETTRDKWHKADFDRVKKDPESIKLKREEWILNHDAEAHAYQNWSKVIAGLQH